MTKTPTRSKAPAMDKRTLTALKGSIGKWEKIADGSGMDGGRHNCPLCELFNNLETRCNGCPVKMFSGKRFCKNTPYVPWLREKHRMAIDVALTPKLRRLARAELRFLKSLLPSVPVRKATRRAVAGKSAPRRSRT